MTGHRFGGGFFMPFLPHLPYPHLIDLPQMHYGIFAFPVYTTKLVAIFSGCARVSPVSTLQNKYVIPAFVRCPSMFTLQNKSIFYDECLCAVTHTLYATYFVGSGDSVTPASAFMLILCRRIYRRCTLTTFIRRWTGVQYLVLIAYTR